MAILPIYTENMRGCNWRLNAQDLSILQPTSVEEGQLARLRLCDQTILECVKKTLHRYGGSMPNLFLYNIKSKHFLKDFDIPSKPEELEECLDNIFDGASIIIKSAIITEVSLKCGFTHDCTTLKEAFEFARNN
jgi:hypothetical protein